MIIANVQKAKKQQFIFEHVLVSLLEVCTVKSFDTM